MARNERISSKRSALRIVAVYATFGMFWILFSDQVLLFLAPTREVYRLFQTLKGGLYVVVTGVFLFFLIRSEVEQNARLLAERELLLAELDHRVKNNLQVVLSLVSIQRNSSPVNGSSQMEILSAQVRTLLAAHDLSREAGSPDTVPLGSYVLACSRTARVLLSRGSEVSQVLDQYEISTDNAIALGLVINELAPPSGRGEVVIDWSEHHSERDPNEPPALDLSLTFSSGDKLPDPSPILAGCVQQLSGDIKEMADGRLRATVALAPHPRSKVTD